MRNRVISNFRGIKNWLAGVLLKRRWLLLVLLAVSALVFEILEHQDVDNPVDLHFVREIIFFGLIYPIAAGLLLQTMLRVQEEHGSIVRQQKIEQAVRQRLQVSYTWEDFCNSLIEIPLMIAPAVGVCVFSISGDLQSLILEAERWFINPTQRPIFPQPIPSHFCGVTDHIFNHEMHPFLPELSDAQAATVAYCLPLIRNQSLLGVLYLVYSNPESITGEQMRTFDHIAPTLALAFENAKLRDPLRSTYVMIPGEREQIARQLHDNLGQNLAYLQLKLDQLSGDDQLVSITSIQRDLERMRDIAHEAHEQIRYTMVNLKTDRAVNLNQLLYEQAQTVANQAGFELNYQVTGDIRTLSSTVQRKIIAIFREGLNNVQRHAMASNVTLMIQWDSAASLLTVELEDDGQGFDLERTIPTGHFGLIIMQQRAEEIRADLTITSAATKGTRVVLQCPY